MQAQAPFIMPYHVIWNRIPHHFLGDSHPRLSEEAGANIAKFYAQLRSKEVDNKTLPVTARTLETLIRLSSAHAKVRGVYGNSTPSPVTHNLPTVWSSLRACIRASHICMTLACPVPCALRASFHLTRPSVVGSTESAVWRCRGT